MKILCSDPHQNAYGSDTSYLTVSLPASVSFQYDLNGNLTSDGTRSFAYDTENQLTNITVANQWKTDFVYDGLGRRRIQRDYGWNSSSWGNPTNEVRFIYDGFQVIQERNAANQVPATYTRGPDLSGSLEGAGGIGGLLARSTSASQHSYYHADGAGNVTGLMDQNGNMAARYLYGPFGRLLGKWGPMADANAMQFSSMPVHRQSGLSFYPFRPYEPGLDRWLSRDTPHGATGARSASIRSVQELGEVTASDSVARSRSGAFTGMSFAARASARSATVLSSSLISRSLRVSFAVSAIC